MIVIRLAGLFFAFVQVTLFLRLLLPFVEVPQALAEYVPTLMEITDLWIAPVSAVLERFELAGVGRECRRHRREPGRGAGGLRAVVLLAMIAWAVLAMFVLFVLRLVFRPAR